MIMGRSVTKTRLGRVMREEVAHSIRSSILTGALPRGSRLDILAIAGEMGVSQLPVREALIALSSEGLVRSEPRRGYFVEEMDPIDVLDHYEIYGKISGVAAARAAATMSSQDIDDLAELNERMRTSKSADEQEDLNQEFHRRINRAGGSRRSRSVLRSLSRGMDVRFSTLIPAWQSAAADEHDLIITALRQHDDSGARGAMEQHLIVNGQRAVDALACAGFFTSPDGGEAAPQP